MTSLLKTNNRKILETTYLIPLEVACVGEAHIVTDSLKNPCTIDIAKNLLEENIGNLVFNIPLPNKITVREITQIIGGKKISRIF